MLSADASFQTRQTIICQTPAFCATSTPLCQMFYVTRLRANGKVASCRQEEHHRISDELRMLAPLLCRRLESSQDGAVECLAILTYAFRIATPGDKQQLTLDLHTLLRRAYTGFAASYQAITGQRPHSHSFLIDSTLCPSSPLGTLLSICTCVGTVHSCGCLLLPVQGWHALELSKVSQA